MNAKDKTISRARHRLNYDSCLTLILGIIMIIVIGFGLDLNSGKMIKFLLSLNHSDCYLIAIGRIKVQTSSKMKAQFIPWPNSSAKTE